MYSWVNTSESYIVTSYIEINVRQWKGNATNLKIIVRNTSIVIKSQDRYKSV